MQGSTPTALVRVAKKAGSNGTRSEDGLNGRNPKRKEQTMTYTEARNTQEAKSWKIRKSDGKYQPIRNGLGIGIAHDTVDAARIFVTSCIAYHSKDAQRERQDTINQLYRDFDIC